MTTSMEIAGTTKLRSAQERAAAKRKKKRSSKAVPVQMAGLPTAWEKREKIESAELSSFIPLLRQTFPIACARTANANIA